MKSISLRTKLPIVKCMHAKQGIDYSSLATIFFYYYYTNFY